MDVFGCFAVSNTVKQRKSKFLHNFILLKKGDDLHGQFVSIAERELAALWYCGLFGYLYVLISLFIVCFTYLPHILVSKVVYYINIQNFARGQAPQYLGPHILVADLPGRRSLRSVGTSHRLVPPVKPSTVGSRAFPVVGPQIWNDLPADVTSPESLSTFRRRLKTHLFINVISWLFPNPSLVDPAAVFPTLATLRKFWLIGFD